MGGQVSARVLREKGALTLTTSTPIPGSDVPDVPTWCDLRYGEVPRDWWLQSHSKF